MNYLIEFKPRAIKDLKKLGAHDSRRVIEKIELMQNDLAGDVKRLTNFTPEYRCAWAIIASFEISGQTVVIYRVLHRKDAYR